MLLRCSRPLAFSRCGAGLGQHELALWAWLFPPWAPRLAPVLWRPAHCSLSDACCGASVAWISFPGEQLWAWACCGAGLVSAGPAWCCFVPFCVPMFPCMFPGLCWAVCSPGWCCRSVCQRAWSRGCRFDASFVGCLCVPPPPRCLVCWFCPSCVESMHGLVRWVLACGGAWLLCMALTAGLDSCVDWVPAPR